MSTAVIIRMCYMEDYPDARWRWRRDYFRDYTLPRLLDQSEPFDLWIWTHPRHRAEVEALHPKIKTFLCDTGGAPLDSRIPWRHVVGLPRYEVQIRVDSDDFLHHRFIKRALKELAQMPQERALVWFQPYKMDVTTGKVYWCVPGRGRGSYGNDKPSAFLALRQPVNHPEYSWVYAFGHTRIHRVADKTVGVLEGGYCWASCHGYNDSTFINPGDRYIGMFEGWKPLPVVRCPRCREQVIEGVCACPVP